MKGKMPLYHPGLILRDEVITANGLSVTEAAKLLDVTRPTLSNLLNAKADISTEMSLRIEMVFGGSAEFWLQLQTDFNLYQARAKMGNVKLKAFVKK
ncbi:addiction module HigA family antidote [Chitinophaga dinghuensis]|uniref:Addiction module HigA family antidote n=1 Tax=Chitinophaga dinghuensis TaxID=1539050 RepID=A0A327W370_9BACT|nr:HigA family addiction module antitoxin [Chitinophaga dinghuensis]RAJ83657.1 addiction module HigA family antidote [Chitinophaga dinghuensis]